MTGLGMFSATGSAIALTGVRITAHVSALGQKVIVEQVFVNREPVAIEALYTFPLPAGAAVCGFEAITSERVLTGQIETLDKGIEQYETAVKDGHGAFMAEQWRPDVFSLRLKKRAGRFNTVRLPFGRSMNRVRNYCTLVHGLDVSAAGTGVDAEGMLRA